MNAKDEKDDGEKLVTPLALENLADILTALAGRYRQAAKMMRDSQIEQMKLGGIPTAIRGIRYLSQNTKAITATITDNEKMLDEVAPELSSDLVKALGGAIAESVTKSKKPKSVGDSGDKKR